MARHRSWWIDVSGYRKTHITATLAQLNFAAGILSADQPYQVVFFLADEGWSASIAMLNINALGRSQLRDQRD